MVPFPTPLSSLADRWGQHPDAESVPHLESKTPGHRPLCASGREPRRGSSGRRCRRGWDGSFVLLLGQDQVPAGDPAPELVRRGRWIVARWVDAVFARGSRACCREGRPAQERGSRHLRPARPQARGGAAVVRSDACGGLFRRRCPVLFPA